MPYEYLDHVADVGLRASGATLAEAFAAAAQGLLDLQVGTAGVEAVDRVSITVQAGDPGALLVSFLNAIIAEQEIRRCFFKLVEVDDFEINGEWRISARLAGEPVDLTRHQVLSEVKAATYSGLRTEIRSDGVLLQCVLAI
jgi:SHS2 domain-containing protein